MEHVFLLIVVLICLLAIGDLIVGVSNDAVNFLSSAIGSRAIPFRRLMIYASLGIIVGAIFSSGMMEVARKGIFNPSEFFFDEIIFIFLAVMLTDILLLDFFNTLGLPTSTTVSIVFELLGAAVAMSVIKLLESGQDLSLLYNYINTDKSLEIIIGILLSVVIAFTSGSIIQWIVRLALGFHLKNGRKWINALFGGASLAALCYFIFIKGIKGSAYADMSFDSLGGLSLPEYIQTNRLVVLGFSALFWTFISYWLQMLAKVNIYKLIIGVGTFALALAFAGNDLVNFIGVPIAAFQAFQIWIASGISATEFSMVDMAGQVKTPIIFLIIAGFIMVLTLWVNAKAKRVVKTSIDLSNQHQVNERFKSNLLAVGLVGAFNSANQLLVGFFPLKLKSWMTKRFQPMELPPINGIRPAFDQIRASINLVVAALLISWATTLKLPLSTTYVTFMVAMGTSLADRAWQKGSAVYRVSGVIHVIGGWFITALSAFMVSAILLTLLHFGQLVSVIVMALMVVLLIIRSHRNIFKKDFNQSK
ncbi:MAG: inorganic phosphate transporter [Flavobacteriaceae bacterium]|nr:inorganic phosphate transporter [Flavobacteriaceae bacterium]